MANNKMLIDASHPEETRVVVVRGNRIEEFDFEAQERRQLRGNIYLAKVTRVEPSLQAAFIDYGGNRHGFLAFSEIHPDYYQIPAADRQALLDAEAAAHQDDEEEEAEVTEVNSVDDADNDNDSSDDSEEEAQPKKRARRKPRRNSRTRKTKETSEDASDDAEASEDSSSDANGDNGAKKDASGDSDSANDGDDSDASGNKTMAAMMDVDSISEDAPDESDSDGEASEPAAIDAGEEAPKKKTRRQTRRKAPAKKKAEAETVDDADKPQEATEPAPEVETAKGDAEPETDASTEVDGDSDEKPSEQPKKSRRTSRTRRGGKKETKAEDASDESSSEADASSDNGDNGNGNKAEVELVGKEDALEEVPVKRPRRQYKIQEVIRRRQVMLVQVVKEERGNKGAALTTYLSLAGRYSVLMPNTARGGGISRKITNPGDRKRLKEIANSLDVPKGMGVILRTAGASLEKEEINRDFDYLMRLWENVRNLTLESSAPFLVYEEGSLIKRSLRDLYNSDIGEIIVSGENGFNEAKNFMQMMMPDEVKNVKFYSGEQPLLSKFNIESQLEKMVTPQVTLKSGGYLVINQTEALVAIDVNSGRSTREHSIEATALQTNLEAAEEVARQLRLRDLAGLVVIDFIDMEEKRNNRAVERKLKDCLKHDRARIQVGHISHFGLMEMSRQRIRASVLESTMAVCPVCQGVGHVRSESSFALQVLRAIDDHLTRHQRFDVVVKVAPSTAMYILNQKRQAVSELESRYGVKIAFEPDYHMQSQDFAVEKGLPSTSEPVAQKAINPMDLQSDEPEEAQVAAAGSNNNGQGDDDENRNDRKNNKRRRGRNRGRGRDRDDNSDNNSEGNSNNQNGQSADSHSEKPEKAEASTEANAPSENIAPAKTDDTSAAEAPEQDKKPSRGSRPGKASSKAKKPVQETEKVTDKVETETAEPAEPTEPRRRTGRLGKKAVSDSVEAEAKAETEETTSTGPTGAPPKKVVRRNTKRVAKPKAETEASEAKSDDDEMPTSFSGGFLS